MTIKLRQFWAPATSMALLLAMGSPNVLTLTCSRCIAEEVTLHRLYHGHLNLGICRDECHPRIRSNALDLAAYLADKDKSQPKKWIPLPWSKQYPLPGPQPSFEPWYQIFFVKAAIPASSVPVFLQHHVLRL